jgi:starch phosphorylase
MNEPRTIAYFSMEIGLEAGIPTYSGGLGILAGDTLRAAADLQVPMVGMTLLHRKGYFHQRLDANGWQYEEPVVWAVDDFLTEMPPRVAVLVEGRTVQLRAWRYQVAGISGYTIPVYFLDADLPENTDGDRALTHYLYGGDPRYRLCQEIILGVGGVRMLRALGYRQLERFHMNEGHASLLTIELLEEEAQQAGRKAIVHDDIEKVRQKCVFTTHTPVPAGHDQFPMELVRRVLGPREVLVDTTDPFGVEFLRRVLRPHAALTNMQDVFRTENVLNLTYLALNLSRYINGVAKQHGEVSRLMFAGYTIDAITNGVHAATWAAKPFQELFDRHIPGWRQDNFSLRYALGIPGPEVAQAHAAAKKELLRHVNQVTNLGLDGDVLTLGFARRAAPYKRWGLLFQDLDRLRRIAATGGPLQVIYAGKAHPGDHEGKEMIRRVLQVKAQLQNEIKIAYLENYTMDLAKLVTAGVDVWLNTPQPPLEASGTSGMKAALNGVPSLSVLDGWWIEGHIEGVTGWAIGENSRSATHDPSQDAASLYAKLEGVLVPQFYRQRNQFLDVMRHCIALNGSFFNTQRMVQQYVLNAYFR